MNVSYKKDLRQNAKEKGMHLVTIDIDGKHMGFNRYTFQCILNDTLTRELADLMTKLQTSDRTEIDTSVDKGVKNP